MPNSSIHSSLASAYSLDSLSFVPSSLSHPSCRLLLSRLLSYFIGLPREHSVFGFLSVLVFLELTPTCLLAFTCLIHIVLTDFHFLLVLCQVNAVSQCSCLLDLHSIVIILQALFLAHHISNKEGPYQVEYLTVI